MLLRRKGLVRSGFLGGGQRRRWKARLRDDVVVRVHRLRAALRESVFGLRVTKSGVHSKWMIEGLLNCGVTVDRDVTKVNTQKRGNEFVRQSPILVLSAPNLQQGYEGYIAPYSGRK